MRDLRLRGKSAIALMAWKKQPKNFVEILPYTSDGDESVKLSALRALESLAGPQDQGVLIKLLSENENPAYVSLIRQALIAAAGKITDPEKRSSGLMKALGDPKLKSKIIPILPKTGGRDALTAVLKEFENGDPDTRAIAFKALTSWSDYTASSALYEICASGNKTYEEQAFKGYVVQVKSASLPDELEASSLQEDNAICT